MPHVARHLLPTVSFLLLLVLPAAVKASCGDYVHVGERAAAQDRAAPTPAKPCDGPECSRHDQPLVPLAPTAPATTADDWCWALPVPQPLTARRLGRVELIDAGMTSGRASDIFHPPR